MNTTSAPNRILSVSGIRAQQLFEESIKDKIAEEDRWKHLIIDLKSGDYEVGRNDIEIEERLLERHPDADLYLLRADGGPSGSMGGANPCL